MARELRSLLNIRAKVRPESGAAYAVATAFVVVAVGVHWTLDLIAEDVTPFTTFYPAVLFAALLGGIGPGTWAAVTSGLIGWWAILPPKFSFLPLTVGQQVSLVVYIVSALMIVWGADRYRRLANELREQEQFRKVVIIEIGQRLKSRVAGILSIVSSALPDNPDLRDRLHRRLRALSATNELIMAVEQQGGRLGDIIGNELSAYDSKRIQAQGPNVLLPSALAITVAMVVHELATNAAKYGALANASGRLSVDWTIEGGVLMLDWRERSGSAVGLRKHAGYGFQLLSRALDPFQGTIETNFAEHGLAVAIRCPVPAEASADAAAAGAPDLIRRLVQSVGGKDS